MGLNIIINLVSIFLLIATLNGCMKKPETKVDYGPESNVADISKAIDAAVGEESPFYYKNQEEIMIESTQLLRGATYPTLVGRYAFKFISKLESDVQMRLDHISVNQQINSKGIVVDEVNKQDYNCFNKITQKEETCTIYPVVTAVAANTNPISTSAYASSTSAQSEQPTQTDINPFKETTISLFKENILKVFATTSTQDSNDTKPRVTFHKFATSTYVANPPDLVKGRENCGGVPDCKINITKITFDRVTWSSENTGEMASFTFEYSKDVPQLARQMNGCVQESIPVPQHGEPESQAPRVLVTSCQTVQDFKYGTN